MRASSKILVNFVFFLGIWVVIEAQDLCDLNPCQTGEVCLEVDGSFTCISNEDSSEISKDLCQPPCQTGEDCIEVDESVKCVCFSPLCKKNTSESTETSQISISLVTTTPASETKLSSNSQSTRSFSEYTANSTLDPTKNNSSTVGDVTDKNAHISVTSDSVSTTSLSSTNHDITVASITEASSETMQQTTSNTGHETTISTITSSTAAFENTSKSTKLSTFTSAVSNSDMTSTARDVANSTTESQATPTDFKTDNATVSTSTNIFASTEATELMTSTETTEWMTSTETTELMTSTETTELMTSTEATELMTSTETTELMTSTETTELMTSTETTELMKSTETTEFMTSTKSTELMTSTEFGQQTSTDAFYEDISVITFNPLTKSASTFDDDNVSKKTDLPTFISTSTPSESTLTNSVMSTHDGASSEHPSEGYTNELSTQEYSSDTMDFETTSSAETEKRTMTVTPTPISSSTVSEFSNITTGETSDSIKDVNKSSAPAKVIASYIGFGIAGILALVSLLSSAWYIKRRCKKQNQQLKDYDATSETSINSIESYNNIV